MLGLNPCPNILAIFTTKFTPIERGLASLEIHVTCLSSCKGIHPAYFHTTSNMIKDEKVVCTIQVRVVLGYRTHVRELPPCVSQCTASEQSKWAGAALSNWAAPSAFLWPNCSRSARKWSQWTRARRPGPPFDWTGEWPTCPTFIPSSCSSRTQSLLPLPPHATFHTYLLFYIFTRLLFSRYKNQRKIDTVQEPNGSYYVIGQSVNKTLYMLAWLRKSTFQYER